MSQPLPELPPAAAEALARGDKIEAVKLVRAAFGCDLKEAKEIVEGRISGGSRAGSASAPEEFPAEAVRALAEGRVIDAIKRVREETGCGLKEAKDRVDAFLAANPLLAERSRFETAAVSGVGCVALVVLVGLLVLGLLFVMVLRIG